MSEKVVLEKAAPEKAISEKRKLCPFCQNNNRCTVNSDAACWCSNTIIPEGLVALLPLSLKDKRCICLSCIKDYKNDTLAFTHRHNNH